MPQPQTFQELLNTVYDLRNQNIMLTPYSGDHNNLSSAVTLHWNAWEAQAALNWNAINIFGEGDIGRIHSIPDSVAARRRSQYQQLINNMPYGSRR